ncbi:MAG: histidinol-phosphatase HisJ family protein [Bacteroidales bacterium]
MLVDYHTHTFLSDGKGKHNEFVKAAYEKGFEEIGFSDHFSIVPTEWGINENDIQYMKETIIALKENTNLPLKIKFGAEIDYIPGKEKETEKLISSLPLDYVIGSIHFIEYWNFDTSPDHYDDKDIETLYEKYFNLLNSAVNTGMFDIVGHADVIKKFNHRPKKKPMEMYEKVIESIATNNMTVELNTSGKNKPCKEFYPDITFLEMCYQNNIPMMINSDAHKPDQIGQYFMEAAELLKKIGFKKISTFTERKRKMVTF